MWLSGSNNVAASVRFDAEGKGTVILRGGEQVRVDLAQAVAAFHVLLEPDMDGTDEFILLVPSSGEAVVLPADTGAVPDLIRLAEGLLGPLIECDDGMAGGDGVGAIVHRFGQVGAGVELRFITEGVGGWLGRMFGARALTVRASLRDQRRR